MLEATTGSRSTQRAPKSDPNKKTPRGLRGVLMLEATTGLEPVIGVLQTLALPTWLRRLE